MTIGKKALEERAGIITPIDPRPSGADR